MKPLTLTLDAPRVKGYSLIFVYVTAATFGVQFARAAPNFAALTDFPAFYCAGAALLSGGMYDRHSLKRCYHELAPDAPPEWELPFVYPPFFALIFAPLACLPYVWAYAAWLALSFGLFAVGFSLLWSTTRLPDEWRGAAFSLALAFPPAFVYCLLAGQTSTVGFCLLALAFYADKKDRPALCGLALSCCLYKPPLLALILPVLLLTRRWRALGWFTAGGVVLGLLSLILVGFDGLRDYVAVLSDFAHAKSNGTSGHPLYKFIDLQSALLLLTGNAPLSSVIMAAGAVLLAVPLVILWLRRHPLSWALALAWTPVLNLYVPIYDATILIIPAVAGIDYLNAHGRSSRVFKYALAALFVSALITQNAAMGAGLQLFTLVIIAFGINLYATARKVFYLYSRP